jgi:hypothetical protein
MAKPVKSKRERKRRLADGLRELGDAAIAEHIQRPCSPRIKIEKTKKGWRFACPYSDKDAPQWEALLLQAFGTRHSAVMNHFLDALTQLVGDGYWDEARNAWMPKQEDFDAMLALIHAMRPANAAEAAHAAQLCALHLSAMKLGRTAARYGCERTTAVLNKTVRAYGDGLERLARLQGRLAPREVTQTIQVVYVDQRDQRIQIAGGVPSIGGQGQGTAGGAIVSCPALPGPDKSRPALPVASGQGAAAMPLAWLWKRLWRSIRGTQRELEARRLDA